MKIYSKTLVYKKYVLYLCKVIRKTFAPQRAQSSTEDSWTFRPEENKDSVRLLRLSGEVEKSLTFKNTNQIMARSVTYSVVPRRNPSEKGTPPKYYAQAQARGDVSLRDMAERIQSTCTVHKSDVYAVLVALEDVVADAIQNGEIVRLGDLCTLQVSLSGKGALTEEDYTTDLIKRAKINFRPGTVLANALASLTFSKVRVKYTKEAEEDSGEVNPDEEP